MALKFRFEFSILSTYKYELRDDSKACNFCDTLFVVADHWGPERMTGKAPRASTLVCLVVAFRSRAGGLELIAVFLKIISLVCSQSQNDQGFFTFFLS